MADEFGKGMAIATGAGLIWMVLAGWYKTPSFEGKQLTGAVPESPNAFDAMGIIVMDGLFWFTILGTLTFWLVIPAAREARARFSS
ncbi:DUF7314 family protein [Haloarchaeobius sp. TZWWS8]|uniref:DUF7314 family protein n=1 Tax=Haloarchaeobius sp. TZWWS8 TaxID=3446121 RepID=UPI003EBA18F6